MKMTMVRSGSVRGKIEKDVEKLKTPTAEFKAVLEAVKNRVTE